MARCSISGGMSTTYTQRDSEGNIDCEHTRRIISHGRYVTMTRTET